MTFLSIFAGIGGIDLGLERAGMRCIGQVEIDPFCRRVLAKHWPDVPRFEDVRTVTAADFAERPDLIAGGFPCQDISNAGKKAGIDGERSGLWSEFHRLICEIRPRFVFVENVSALLFRGAGRVLGDLAACGFDAEWDCIPAAALGAPHIRDRLFIVGHANRDHGSSSRTDEAQRGTAGLPVNAGQSPLLADAEPMGRHGGRGVECDEEESRCGRGQSSGSNQVLAHAGYGAVTERTRTAGRKVGERTPKRREFGSLGEVFSNADRESLGRIAESRGQRGEWATEPDVGRVAHGIPARVDRLKGLGNAVVPQVAEWIGRRILAADQGTP